MLDSSHFILHATYVQARQSQMKAIGHDPLSRTSNHDVETVRHPPWHAPLLLSGIGRLPRVNSVLHLSLRQECGLPRVDSGLRDVCTSPRISDTPVEAAMAYDTAAYTLWGEGARIKNAIVNVRPLRWTESFRLHLFHIDEILNTREMYSNRTHHQHKQLYKFSIPDDAMKSLRFDDLCGLKSLKMSTSSFSIVAPPLTDIDVVEPPAKRIRLIDPPYVSRRIYLLGGHGIVMLDRNRKEYLSLSVVIQRIVLLEMLDPTTKCVGEHARPNCIAKEVRVDLESGPRAPGLADCKYISKHLHEQYGVFGASELYDSLLTQQEHGDERPSKQLPESFRNQMMEWSPDTKPSEEQTGAAHMIADYSPSDGDELDSEIDEYDSPSDDEYLSEKSAASEAEVTTEDSQAEPRRKRYAVSAFGEGDNDILTRIAPFVATQIQAALQPLISSVTTRYKCEEKHRQMMLAMEEEKLALMRQNLEFTRTMTAVRECKAATQQSPVSLHPS